MDAVERAQDRVDAPPALLRDYRSAQADVPHLDRPTSAVGRAGSWTGTAATRLHHDELSPLATRLPRALSRAEQAIVDELAHAERTLRNAKADAAEDDS